jgi:virginiamycin A acetyltransferase
VLHLKLIKFIRRLIYSYNLRRRNVHIAKGSHISLLAKVGRYTRINAASHIGPCIIGSFCAIGGRLIVRSTDHFTNHLNMQEHFQREILGSSAQVAGRSKGITKIGNAVWIGDSVIVLSGVQIGDGAVIGAGSVVTKNIPAFAVAVGNPARVIKYRFDLEIVRELEKLNWWDWDDEKIKLNKYLFDLDFSRLTLDEVKKALSNISQ